jgi:hypothetical protein
MQYLSAVNCVATRRGLPLLANHLNDPRAEFALVWPLLTEIQLTE